ncbi:MAG: helix-turn-helix domain-containing protein [bacterium]|nr:helix-turn-helix domain-containing protein [bacterium]
MNYIEIGQRIRKYRKQQNLSQEELAEKIGISTTHMSHIETGSTKLSLPVLVDLAKNLNVKTDWLLFDESYLDNTEAVKLLEQVISLLK